MTPRPLFSTLGLAALAMLLICGPSHAQGPDLNDLVLDWSRGRYASPLLCEIGGEMVRGLRRVLIAPGPAHLRPPANKLLFVDLDVDAATRCFTELESSTPNVVGFVYVRHPTRGRNDTAQRDFDAELKRKGGFELEIPEGRLRLTPVGEGSDEPQIVDFRGGRAHLRQVAPGSDAQRVLSDFSSPRKLVLELIARDGHTLRFPVFLSDLR